MQNTDTIFEIVEPTLSDEPVKPRILDLPDALVSYYPNLFSEEENDELLENLIVNVEWKQNRIKIFGRESPVPRLEAWYGDEGKSYTYSGITMHPKPWTPVLLSIKERAESSTGATFNSVLVNFYRAGAARVAWHSDDEKELGPNPVIASVSFGAERKFRLRHKGFDENGRQAEINLGNGSLLLMGGKTQGNWKHEIPKTSRSIGPRINLTFRKIL